MLSLLGEFRCGHLLMVIKGYCDDRAWVESADAVEGGWRIKW